jgi:hypothetical protein
VFSKVYLKSHKWKIKSNNKIKEPKSKEMATSSLMMGSERNRMMRDKIGIVGARCLLLLMVPSRASSSRLLVRKFKLEVFCSQVHFNRMVASVV